MEWGQRKAAGVLGEETRVQLQLLLASYAEPESDTTGEESGDTEEEEGGCAHSSAYITRSRCEQPVPSKLVSDDSDAGSGSDCDGWVFDDDGGCAGAMTWTRRMSSSSGPVGCRVSARGGALIGPEPVGPSDERMAS